MPTPNVPSPQPFVTAAWQWVTAHIPTDWGTWVAVVVLVAIGLAQLPAADSAGHKPAPPPLASPIDPNCPTLEPETATTAVDPDKPLQDWRYARGKWVRLTEELGIPVQPANFVQRVSPLLWAALLWVVATWILVASA